VELFAGAAGLAQGFIEEDSFAAIAFTDREPSARDTVEAYLPGVPYLLRDVVDLRPAELRAKADGRRIVGVLGGPPCGGFSLAGAGGRSGADVRTRYVREYARIVRALDPDFLLMENVPQVFFHESYERLRDTLDERYLIESGVLNAAEYGVPQTRHRAFVLAYHRRLGVTPRFPTPTHGTVGRAVFSYVSRKIVHPSRAAQREVLGADSVVRKELIADAEQPTRERLLPLVNVADAIGDLLGLGAGSGASTYGREPTTDYQRRARSPAAAFANHVARAHNRELLRLICAVPEGGGLADVPRRLWPTSHYSQAYGRLHGRGLARTVTGSFCNAGSGRFIHYADQRTITVREAARLQGFKDEVELHGHQWQQMLLVGNAVPPPLARAIARQVAQDLIRAGLAAAA
jgi:DNA (cytosine-5)-methyltransferase 1